MSTDDIAASLHRRELLRRVAAAGGTALVAPALLDSVLSPAAAYSPGDGDTPPGAPTITTVTTTPSTATVTYTPPGNDGGDPITSYEYTLNNGTSWAIAGASPFTITGLNATGYTIRVRAVNGGGGGTPSNAFTVNRLTPSFTPGTPNIEQTHLVGAGVQQITMTAIGGAGGAGGPEPGIGGDHGQPGTFSQTIAVTPAESLTISVGTGGGNGGFENSGNNDPAGGTAGTTPFTGYDGAAGGGGMRPNGSTPTGGGGGGGGGTLIRRAATILVAAAGGGGGGGSRMTDAGGNAPAAFANGGAGTNGVAGATAAANTTGGGGGGGGGVAGGAGGTAVTNSPGTGGSRGSNTGGDTTAAAGRTAGQPGQLNLNYLQALPV